ncbi:MAG: tetratricopeptide repeat domain protein [Myxococcaceae bacterium]|nr:tetratricopeptide repeat domain protein [Myxococcaceae bacterium]
MDPALERLLEKIEDGDALTDAELEQLSSFVRKDGGRVLRTALAQALLNADAVSEAMAVLEALERDFPHDVQVALARARAFVSQERYAEAEAPLQHALRLNPGDPEATKALAVLAMRRGELDRARVLINQVLRQDPFDSEAQQLSAELDAPGDLPAQSIPLLNDFTARLVKQLTAQSTPHLLQKDQLLVRLGKGGVARLDLKSLYRGFLDGAKSLDVAVEVLARELAERTLGIPAGRLPLLATALPVVRDSTFLDRAVGAAHREGPAGLLFFYTLRDPELVRYIPEGVLRTHRLSLEELDTAAWKNLAAEIPQLRAIELELGALRLSPAPTGLWAIAVGDGHDAARLLSPPHQALLEERLGAGPLRVYLGLRELVLLCRSDDVPNLAKLQGLEASPDGIAGAFCLQARRISRLDDWEK